MGDEDHRCAWRERVELLESELAGSKEQIADPSRRVKAPAALLADEDESLVFDKSPTGKFRAMSAVEWVHGLVCESVVHDTETLEWVFRFLGPVSHCE